MACLRVVQKLRPLTALQLDVAAVDERDGVVECVDISAPPRDAVLGIGVAAGVGGCRPGVHAVEHSVEASFSSVHVEILLLKRDSRPADNRVRPGPMVRPRQPDDSAAWIWIQARSRLARERQERGVCVCVLWGTHSR